MRPIKFSIERSADKQYYVRIHGGNGEPMYTSETVKRKIKCVESIRRIGGKDAIVEDNAPDLRKSNTKNSKVKSVKKK